MLTEVEPESAPMHHPNAATRDTRTERNETVTQSGTKQERNDGLRLDGTEKLAWPPGCFRGSNPNPEAAVGTRSVVG
jgi:hypothetical protein